ncbi:MAG TPA: DUF4962 domain-containing protein [Armatimonadota bacterium]|nr:DUF4962 domain-containing protein [Armatimonadota bacterium]
MNRIHVLGLTGVLIAMSASQAVSDDRDLPVTGHPRLFFTEDELDALRAEGEQGARRLIRRNLVESADWCLERPLRQEWIAPVAPDPIHANLYDRFYAMMHDMAVMEHLAFTWRYTGKERYGSAAVDWALACCRVWGQEAEGTPDGSKAYAVTRLLKGLGVSYDLLHDRLTDEERDELRGALIDIGGAYYDGYFTLPSRSGPDFHAHHAIVEHASFGVAALAVLGEHEPADQWVRATVTKFRDHLLPMGLADDGAQVEGATFWASTMQYRLAFMDALQRVTGEDLFTPFAEQMDARLALASVAGVKADGYDRSNDTVILEPSYGQVNYYSPVLVGLARAYRGPLYQHLALWDQAAGSVQRTRYVTDSGEWMLFGWGGYAYAWYDPTVPAAIEAGQPLSFQFPSVNEAYMRSSYEERGIVAGMRRNAVVVHAGGRTVFADRYNGHHPPSAVPNVEVEDAGSRAAITCAGAADSGFTRQSLVLRRPSRLTLTRHTDSEQVWSCHGRPTQKGNALQWPDGTTLEIREGTLAAFEPQGHEEELIVGMGLLKLADPMPTAYPLMRAQPEDGRLVVAIRTPR